jgi:hypothetical protein
MSGYDFISRLAAASRARAGHKRDLRRPELDHQNGIRYTGGSIRPRSRADYKTSNATRGPQRPGSTYPIRALLAYDTQRAWAAGGSMYSGVGGIWATADGAT